MRSTQTDFPLSIQGSHAKPYAEKQRSQEWLPVTGSLLVLVLVTVLVVMQMVPPAVVPRSAPQTVFSAERALDHLQVIARAPHPTGSPENARVREYLVTQLSLLGLQPQVQTSTSVYHDTGKWGLQGPKGLEVRPDTWGLAGATVHNVMARISGTDSSGAVVLAAHYDSVPTGPGASDDGSGVAAILEAARAILSGPPLRNDIILLLTDGEEIGLMGAKAFVNHHPWMEDVALVLNLEARGSGGTILMYETNENNAWIMREYAKSSVAPLTGSVATDVWRVMPNSSDLTLFLQNGKQGMNFAFGENWTAYHTTQDSIEDLDLRSLQHHGANVLALARHFASIEMTNQTTGDAIFFSVLRLGLVLYPKSRALPLVIVATLAYIILMAAGLRSKRLTFRGLLLGTAAFLCAASAAALTGFIVVQVLNGLKSGELVVGHGGTYNVHGYELGLLAVYLSITGAIYTAFQRKTRPADLAMGGLLFWLILAFASTILLAGASYMFLWPLVAGLVVLSIYLFAKEPGRPQETTKGRILNRLLPGLVLLPGIVGLMLAGTVLYLVQLMFGITIFPAGGFLTVLILALAFPYLDLRLLPRPSAWAVIPAVLGVLVILATAIFTRTQADHPRLNFTFYSMDADSGKAGWVAETHLPDPTLATLLGGSPNQAHIAEYFPTEAQDSIWVQDAPTIDSPAPELKVIEDTTDGSVRTLRLNIRSPRGASAVMADVSAKDAILTATLYGESYSREAPRSNVFFKIISVPVSGVEVGLTLRAGVPVTIKVADVSSSLPLNSEQRAEFETALRSGFGGGHSIDSTTLIHRKYEFP
jgi:hypothetical protein